METLDQSNALSCHSVSHNAQLPRLANLRSYFRFLTRSSRVPFLCGVVLLLIVICPAHNTDVIECTEFNIIPSCSSVSCLSIRPRPPAARYFARQDLASCLLPPFSPGVPLASFLSHRPPVKKKFDGSFQHGLLHHSPILLLLLLPFRSTSLVHHAEFLLSSFFLWLLHSILPSSYV